MTKLAENLKTPLQPSLDIAGVISRFLFGSRHDFDLDNPLVDEIETTHKHKLSGNTVVKNWKLEGFKCKNCDKVLWLDKRQMKDLPRSMKVGCSRNGL
jgi:hypothetical protein